MRRIVLPAFAVSSAFAQRASNMALVGYNDLQARSAYQPVIQKQGARWIAYIGHHGGEQLNPLNGKVEQNGTSIVDVTDPKSPRYLAHIPVLPQSGVIFAADQSVPGPLGSTAGAFSQLALRK